MALQLNGNLEWIIGIIVVAVSWGISLGAFYSKVENNTEAIQKVVKTEVYISDMKRIEENQKEMKIDIKEIRKLLENK